MTTKIIFPTKREGEFCCNLSHLIFALFLFVFFLYPTKVSFAKNLELISSDLVYQNSNLNLTNYSADQNMTVVSTEGVTEVFSPGQIPNYMWRGAAKEYYISDPENAKIVADYSNVGTYKGKSISCRVTIYGIIGFYNSVVGYVPGIALQSTWQSGILVGNITHLIYQYDFYYTGASAEEIINLENALWIYEQITIGEKLVYLNDPERTSFVYNPSNIFVDTTTYKGTVYSSVNSTLPGQVVIHDPSYNPRQTMAIFPISGTSQRFILDLSSDEELSFPERYTNCLITPGLSVIDYPFASFFSVLTSATNGTITPSDEGVKENTSKTVSYSPAPGYGLESIAVDGSNVNIRDYPESYTFANVNSNHNIVVTFRRSVRNLSVKKVWQDDSNRDSFRPDNIQFNLFCGSTECGDNPYTITEDDNWTITVPNIPIYDTEGHEYEYSVVEVVEVVENGL